MPAEYLRERLNLMVTGKYLASIESAPGMVIAIQPNLRGSDSLGIIQLMHGLSKFWNSIGIRSFREGLQVQDIDKENKVENYVAKSK